MAEGLAFAFFGKVSNAAVKREAKRRQLIKERPLCHRRSAPAGQRRLSGERRRNLSASEDIERIANSRALSASSSLDMGSSSGRTDLLSKRSGSTPSPESSDDDDDVVRDGFIPLHSTPVDTVETTTLRLGENSGVTECNGVFSQFQSHLPANRITVTITFMVPDENDASSVKTVRVCVPRSSQNDGSLDIEEFAFNASAEDLALFCAEKAGIPSKFFPLFALYSPNHEVFLPPGYEFASLARDTDFIDLEFRIRLALRPPPSKKREDRSTTYSFADASSESEVLREYVYYQLKEDFTEGRIIGSPDAEDGDRGLHGTTLCEVLGSKSKNSKKTITRTTSAGAVDAGSAMDYRFLCLQPATFSLYLDKPADVSVDDYLRRMKNKDINKHLPPNKSLLAQCKMMVLGSFQRGNLSVLDRPNLKDLIRTGFKRIEENSMSERSKIQLNYILRVMNICNPFEERYVHYPPSAFANSSFDRDDGDDEPEEEVVVRLKPNEAYPIIVLNKDKDLVEIPIMDIHRVEVVESRVDLTLNPRTISLSLENPLQAESFVALINSYAMLSPRLDRSYSLCFKGSLGSSPYYHSLNAVKCLVSEASYEMRNLFESAGNDEDCFLVIEDKDKVAHLHIHMLKRVAGKNEARIENVATLVYSSRAGHWRCKAGPNDEIIDSQLRSILNAVVKEKGKNCNVGPLRNSLSLAVLYPSPPAADDARASPKLFTDMEISGGLPIQDRPGFSTKSIVMEGQHKQFVIRRSGKNQMKNDQQVTPRIQWITEWSRSERCPATLLRSIGTCLDPLSLVLEKDAGKLPLDQWMRHVKTSETGDSDFLALSTRTICDQVSRALQFLASRDIPHGNVAASNVVVTAETGVKVKLGDPVFTFTKWEDRIARTAPSLWDFQSIKPLKKSTLIAADVFAFGTFMWEVFSFDALSVIKTIPGVANAKDAKDAKDQTEEFLKHNFLPLPTAPSDKFQDLWERAYKVMEQCWTRDENSRPRISVVNEAIWKYLLSPEPEDMKSFQEFFEMYQELPGAPIRAGDFCDGSREDDGSIIIPDELSEHSYSFESPEGNTIFKTLRPSGGKKSLGKGFFGEVWRAEIVFDKNVQSCAVKKFNENMDEEDIRKEALIGLKVPRHENLVELIGYIHLKTFPPKYLLIMELLDESLEGYLGKVKSDGVEAKDWDWKQQKDILIQITHGIKHLHSQNPKVLHRDLAARNVLLKRSNSSSITAKVGDFGLSRMAENYYAKKNSKTPNYMYPPETLESTRSNFYAEGDVWSFGLLTLEVCSPRRTRMYDEFQNIGGEKAVINGIKFPDLGCPLSIYSGLVLRCLEFRKDDRPLFFGDLDPSRTTLENLINAVSVT